MNDAHVTTISAKTITPLRLVNREEGLTGATQLEAEDVVQAWFMAEPVDAARTVYMPSARKVANYLGPDRGIAAFEMKFSNKASGRNQNLRIRSSQDGSFVVNQQLNIAPGRQAEYLCEYNEKTQSVMCYRWRP